MGIIRRPAVHFAALMLVVAAMVFRGLVPIGWMPGSSAGSLLVICTSSGAARPDAGDKPLGHHTGRSIVCPFGSAPQFATIGIPEMTPIPVTHVTGIMHFVFVQRYRDRPGLDAHSPRAPPTIA